MFIKVSEKTIINTEKVRYICIDDCDPESLEIMWDDGDITGIDFEDENLCESVFNNLCERYCLAAHPANNIITFPDEGDYKCL